MIFMVKRELAKVGVDVKHLKEIQNENTRLRSQMRDLQNQHDKCVEALCTLRQENRDKIDDYMCTSLLEAAELLKNAAPNPQSAMSAFAEKIFLRFK